MDDIIKLMEKAKGRISQRLRKKISEILALCEPYRNLGAEFLFSAVPALSASVDEALLAFSDTILDDIKAQLETAIEEADAEEDRDAIFAYTLGTIAGEDATTRVDKYSSHLKFILEGWVAIAFYNDISLSTMLSTIFVYMDHPFTSPLWQEAFRSGLYASPIIRMGGAKYGKGTPESILKGLTLTNQTMVNQAYQYGRILRYRHDGAIGYRVYRNSTYDCPVCDELCIGIHPLDEIVLPAHPRCVCYTKPVYE